MSKIALTPNSSGTGTFTLAAPDSDTNRTLTLPDSAGELLTTTGDGSGLTGIVIPPIFNPVAVSGATQALDVGSYNFFNAGSLTANTTVSFTSVPTNARWSYSFEPTILSGEWDVSTAKYKQSFSVFNQSTSPRDVFISPDGLNLYVLARLTASINQYSLSTAWDVTTATYLQEYSVYNDDSNPTGIFFKPDGLQMYMIGYSSDYVTQYSLSTAWDISTASTLRTFTGTASEDTAPQGISFKPDGTKMYMAGNSGDAIYEYNLSTAWNISTATFLHGISVSAEASVPTGVAFKSDGTKMYVTQEAGGSPSVIEYNLSTAWDVTSRSHSHTFFTLTYDSEIQGVFFKSDGTKMYVVGDRNNKIIEYDLGVASNVTLPASLGNSPVKSFFGGNRYTYDFFTMDGGTTVTLIGEEVV